MDDIEQAYEDGLVDPNYIRFDDVQRDLAMGKDQVLARLADDPRRRLVVDTIHEMGWWACFRDDRPNRADDAARALVESDLKSLSTGTLNQRKATKPKIGRNEPCPCGSGKKYKKCCHV